MVGEHWSDDENDLIVADYFNMLGLELVGRKFNKAERNRNLREHLSKRNKHAVEFKHHNISAVLQKMGLPWINGYKPRPSFQGSLIDAVLRWLDNKDDWLTKSPLLENSNSAIESGRTIVFGKPPPKTNDNDNSDRKLLTAVQKKYDACEKDRSNRRLGEAGERCVLEYEIDRLERASRGDLAGKVRWTSKVDGDGAGYDIASFDVDGRDRLLEVKTTNGYERTPFYISPNELAVAEQNRDIWHLVRVWDFARQPKAFEIQPPMDEHVSLTPTNFRASLL